jgi:hypothetical protein
MPVTHEASRAGEGNSMEMYRPERGSIELRRELASAAQAYLEGQTSAVEASQHIFAAAIQLDASTSDLLIGITRVASRADTFPLGRVREGWSAEALEREDAAREQFEVEIAEDMNRMCRRVVELFGAQADPSPEPAPDAQ